MALGMVGFVFVWQATGSVALGAAASLGVGALAGLFNGLVVTFVGIPSLVVTIGTQFLFRGLTLVLVNGRSYALVDTKQSPAYDVLVGRPLGIPMEFWWLVIVSVATWVLLNRHRLGQNTYVVGDNRHAATLMGIPIRRTRITLFVLTGLMAAFAGLLNSLQIVNFYPGMGDGYLLHAFTNIAYQDKVTLPALERSLAASGRTRADIWVFGYLMLAASDTEEEQAKVMQAWQAWFGELGAAIVNPSSARKRALMGALAATLSLSATALDRITDAERPR